MQQVYRADISLACRYRTVAVHAVYCPAPGAASHPNENACAKCSARTKRMMIPPARLAYWPPTNRRHFFPLCASRDDHFFGCCRFLLPFPFRRWCTCTWSEKYTATSRPGIFSLRLTEAFGKPPLSHLPHLPTPPPPRP